jgi:hypothetical protein
MPIQRVADQTGDTTYEWDVKDDDAVTKAMERFNDLVNNRKFTAYNPGKDGEGAKQVRAFDPNQEETIFMPQRQGG